MLMVISVVSALIAHRVVRSYILASLLAAVVATIAFQGLIYLDSGHRDPFFIIALGIGGVASLVVAALVGIPFLWTRRKGKRNGARVVETKLN